MTNQRPCIGRIRPLLKNYRLNFLHTFVTYDISTYLYATLFNLDSRNFALYIKRMVSSNFYSQVVELSKHSHDYQRSFIEMYSHYLQYAWDHLCFYFGLFNTASSLSSFLSRATYCQLQLFSFFSGSAFWSFKVSTPTLVCVWGYCVRGVEGFSKITI